MYIETMASNAVLAGFVQTPEIIQVAIPRSEAPRRSTCSTKTAHKNTLNIPIPHIFDMEWAKPRKVSGQNGFVHGFGCSFIRVCKEDVSRGIL
jgi:hypothetical protein